MKYIKNIFVVKTLMIEINFNLFGWLKKTHNIHIISASSSNFFLKNKESTKHIDRSNKKTEEVKKYKNRNGNNKKLKNCKNKYTQQISKSIF